MSFVSQKQSMKQNPAHSRKWKFPASNPETCSAASPFQLVARLGEAIEAPPHQAIHAYDHERDEDCCQQNDGESPVVGRGADLCSKTDGLEGFAFHLRVFRHDRSVPRAA